jgi:carboxylesterase
LGTPVEFAVVSEKPLGCLILHGFTSSLDAVRPLVPAIERLGLPYRMPVLRGHGTRAEDLRGVRHEHWYADAEAALLELRREARKVAICGLSMGGLVALELAARHPEDVAAVVTLGAALYIKSPLIHASKLIAGVVDMWTPTPGRGYNDRALARGSTNYRSFATDALVSLHAYGGVVRRLLGQVRAPILVLHARQDRVIKPASADYIYEHVASQDKQRIFLERCNHEMLLDCESERVVGLVERMLGRILSEELERAASTQA